MCAAARHRSAVTRKRRPPNARGERTSKPICTPRIRAQEEPPPIRHANARGQCNPPTPKQNCAHRGGAAAHARCTRACDRSSHCGVQRRSTYPRASTWPGASGASPLPQATVVFTVTPRGSAVEGYSAAICSPPRHPISGSARAMRAARYGSGRPGGWVPPYHDRQRLSNTCGGRCNRVRAGGRLPRDLPQLRPRTPPGAAAAGSRGFQSTLGRNGLRVRVVGPTARGSALQSLKLFPNSSSRVSSATLSDLVEDGRAAAGGLRHVAVVEVAVGHLPPRRRGRARPRPTL